MTYCSAAAAARAGGAIYPINLPYREQSWQCAIWGSGPGENLKRELVWLALAKSTDQMVAANSSAYIAPSFPVLPSVLRPALEEAPHNTPLILGNCPKLRMPSKAKNAGCYS